MKCTKCNGFLMFYPMFEFIGWRCMNCGKRIHHNPGHENNSIERFFRDLINKNRDTEEGYESKHSKALTKINNLYKNVTTSVCLNCHRTFKPRIRNYKPEIHCSSSCRLQHDRKIRPKGPIYL